LTLVFKDRALHCRSAYSRQLRYLGLRGEKPETVRTLYRLWGESPASVITAAVPEKR
jgi:hypothetical protein